MSTSTRKLVQQSLAGDSGSFDLLVKTYQAAVYGLTYHWTQNFADAQDLTQEAFFQAYEKLDQLEDPDKFAGWLRRIATNLCRMWKRSRKHIESIDAPANQDLRNSLTDPSQQPQEALEVKERQQAVADILSHLSDTVRLTVTLFYIDDLSYQEISTFLGVPVSTVKSRLHKARTQLKQEAIQMVEDTFGQEKEKPEVELKDASGYLHIREEGFGFFRPTPESDSDPTDFYMSHSQIKRFDLQQGDFIAGPARPPRDQEKYFAVIRLVEVNGKPHQPKE